MHHDTRRPPPPSARRRRVWGWVRGLLVAAIFVYLWRTDRFHPLRLMGAVRHADLLALAAGCMVLAVVPSIQRWRVLLRTQGIVMEFRVAWQLTLVGMFFSVAIPGAVGGDLVKGYYLVKEQTRKTALVSTLVADRVIGLYTLVAVAVGAWGYGLCRPAAVGVPAPGFGAPALQALATMTVSLFLGLTLVGLGVLYGPLARWLSFGWVGASAAERVRPFLASLRAYAQRPGLLLAAMGLSLLSQLPVCAALWLLAQALQLQALSPGAMLFLGPLGLLVNAVPLAPGGLGVGETGFQALLHLWGIQGGADLAMLFHALFFAIALALGGAAYLRMGRERWQARPVIS